MARDSPTRQARSVALSLCLLSVSCQRADGGSQDDFATETSTTAADLDDLATDDDTTDTTDGPIGQEACATFGTLEECDAHPITMQYWCEWVPVHVVSDIDTCEHTIEERCLPVAGGSLGCFSSNCGLRYELWWREVGDTIELLRDAKICGPEPVDEGWIACGGTEERYTHPSCPCACD